MKFMQMSTVSMVVTTAATAYDFTDKAGQKVAGVTQEVYLQDDGQRPRAVKVRDLVEFNTLESLIGAWVNVEQRIAPVARGGGLELEFQLVSWSPYEEATTGNGRRSKSDAAAV